MGRIGRKRQRFSLEPQQATIETFSHDGRGIARIDGKITFIQGALPDETVMFQYTNTKRDFDEGKTLSIIKPSHLRAEPRCPHYALCGGCSLQHLSSDAQIHVKQSLLLDLLQRIGHTKPQQLLEPLCQDSWHYRNKARLSVRYVEKKQATLVGFREKNNPRYITEISQCPILNNRVDVQITKLRALIDAFDVPDSIAQIEVAAGDHDVALIFRNLKPLTERDQTRLWQFGVETGFLLFLQPAGVDSVTLFYSPTGNNYLRYALPAEDVIFHFYPTDFTQVNAKLNQVMVRRALDLMDLQDNDVVLDLFCGLGNFSLPLARHSAFVIGVEGSETMVARAQMNAQLNNIYNTRFHCADLEKVDALAKIIDRPITKMLIDPPRCGALAIVKQIDKLNPTTLVYVSCNPATLARDSDILVNQHGYQLKAAGVMDMFPHTAHVESIALFEKG